MAEGEGWRILRETQSKSSHPPSQVINSNLSLTCFRTIVCSRTILFTDMLKAVFASYFERAAHYSSILFNSVVLDCCLFTGYSEMLESDEIYKISFWLCHVFREERHQCIKQLQQGNKKKLMLGLKQLPLFLFS